VSFAHGVTSLDVERPQDERDDGVSVHDVVRQSRPRLAPEQPANEQHGDHGRQQEVDLVDE